ncbi:galactokinase family protein [Aquimarina sp. 2201CG5-10]|uniref:GHMP family kinase ATP-binding protein n=1 Tax=Aquimarina callyspongiae TaxID=3098150 RepID=UPI002AB52144|nr:galactokinase family protein [Aquimarina sp. 2201CG5-10]MDY8138844.1 galactokinase family protein [Aquimarina sp. 2201CG5-10]
MKKISVKSPGRTCLFGDHQDYLGLPVIACAIDRYITLNAMENSSSFFKINLLDTKEKRDISIHQEFENIDREDHFMSALKVVQKYGCIPDKGYDIQITGNLPINAGVSSSSALIIAWIRFLLEAFGAGQEVTPVLVSRIAYEAEVLEHNSPGGLMDQYSIGIGNVLFIDTRDNASYEVIQNTVQGLIVGESGIKKETINTLGDLRGKALEAIKYVKGKKPDFDINQTLFEEYDEYEKYIPSALKPYFFAALKNHSITLKALEEFKKPYLDMSYLGELMNQHHAILKDILKITVPRIDNMVKNALEAGAYGVKIVGSGGGGSIIALSPKDKEQEVINAILKGEGKAAYVVNVDEGARIV